MSVDPALSDLVNAMCSQSFMFQWIIMIKLNIYQIDIQFPLKILNGFTYLSIYKQHKRSSNICCYTYNCHN